MAAPCHRVEPGGILVSVRLTPKADRDAIGGVRVLADGRTALEARVRAAPENGRANEALAALMAKSFRRPKSSVAIVSGATARFKQVRIAGDPVALAAIAEGWQEKSG